LIDPFAPLVKISMRGLVDIIFRIDDSALAHVPPRGPLIIIANHVSILELPVMYLHLQPRPVHGMALATRWKNPIFRYLLNTAGSIPLQRGSTNLDSLRKGLELLKAGHILYIAPEGTRSHNGQLQIGHPGVVLLALKSRAPVLPVAFYGLESYRDNLKRLRRTDFNITVGKPFFVEAPSNLLGQPERQQLADEMMIQLAALLPPQYRGYYTSPAPIPKSHLCFLQD
jgi:1-acyl-sn-glycerol-3-phosphate acyltransferase